jgi:hypothetical protein
MITLFISILAFSVGCLEGEKILVGSETLSMALFERAKELMHIK